MLPNRAAPLPVTWLDLMRFLLAPKRTTPLPPLLVTSLALTTMPVADPQPAVMSPHRVMASFVLFNTSLCETSTLDSVSSSMPKSLALTWLWVMLLELGGASSRIIPLLMWGGAKGLLAAVNWFSLTTLWSMVAAACRNTTTPLDAIMPRIAGLLDPVTTLWST